MGKKVAGTCFVKADGSQFSVSGGVECPLIDVNRETVMAVDGPAGFKETAREPYVKLTAIMVQDFPLQKLQDSTDMTITAELANGKVYVLSGAYLVGDPSVKSEDGTVELEFQGEKGVWQ